MNMLLRCVRYSLRMQAQHPGLAIVAVFSLALGIGANAVVFSIVDGVFLRPWPVKDPSRLVSIFTSTPKDSEDSVSYPEYVDLSQQSTVFTGVLAYGQRAAFVNVGGQGELVTIDVVSPNYFSVVGVRPALGSTFQQTNDLKDPQTGVVISYALWKRRFAGNIRGASARGLNWTAGTLTFWELRPLNFAGSSALDPLTFGELPRCGPP